MKKEFLPHQQSLDLEELGFDEECLGYHLCENSALGVYLEIITEWIDLFPYDSSSCKAPTFSQAFRWFREKYGLNSFVYHYGENGILDTIYFAYNINDNLYAFDFRTYEEAELECIKKLIELCKKN